MITQARVTTGTHLETPNFNIKIMIFPSVAFPDVSPYVLTGSRNRYAAYVYTFFQLVYRIFDTLNTTPPQIWFVNRALLSEFPSPRQRSIHLLIIGSPTLSQPLNCTANNFSLIFPSQIDRTQLVTLLLQTKPQT